MTARHFEKNCLKETEMEEKEIEVCKSAHRFSVVKRTHLLDIEPSAKGHAAYHRSLRFDLLDSSG